jgi:hypothetical protein
MGSGRRWIGTGLAVVVIAVVVFAVTQGSGGGGGTLSTIAKAAEVTQREPGGHAVLHLVSTASTGDEGLTETGSMVFDDTGTAEGTIAVKGHKTGREVTMQAIGDGTTSYVSSDAFDSISEGKKWVKVDFTHAVKVMGSSSLPPAAGPEEGLKILERVEGAHKVGTEDLDGVPTTRYTGSVPPAEEVFGVKTNASPTQADVWIDAQDRVRRMRITGTSAPGETEGTVRSHMTIDYVSFGRVPKIELPAADEVFDMTSELESEFQSAAESH